MARTLKEILDDLNAAEKEYSEKCKKYGIEEKHRKRKQEVQLDENGNPIGVQLDENGSQIEQPQVEQVQDATVQAIETNNKD